MRKSIVMMHLRVHLQTHANPSAANPYSTVHVDTYIGGIHNTASSCAPPPQVINLVDALFP